LSLLLTKKKKKYCENDTHRLEIVILFSMFLAPQKERKEGGRKRGREGKGMKVQSSIASSKATQIESGQATSILRSLNSSYLLYCFPHFPSLQKVRKKMWFTLKH
jgi:hypothetical protein